MIVFFYSPQKENETNDAFLFLDDISLKAGNEAPQRGATAAALTRALLLLLSPLLVSARNAALDEPT